MEKTKVMRVLAQKNIAFVPHEYDNALTDGVSIAKVLGEEASSVFKTLVTESNTHENFVFVIPVCATLNLKKAAAAARVKNIQMIKQKDLLPLTGYIHGGCSPVGMKKPFPTFIEETATLCETICCSAGKVGFQIQLAPDDLVSLVGASYADLV